jgi:hypothetical protein
MAESGGVQLAMISKRLRTLGAEGQGARKEFYSALTRATRPVTDAIRKEAETTLPKSGGRQVRKMKKTGAVEIDGKRYLTRARVGKLLDNESLAHRVANASYTTRIVMGKERGGRRIAQVQIRGRVKSGGTVNLRVINNGTVRHPTFGNREPNCWKDQPVNPGFFTRPALENVKQVSEELRKTVKELADYLGGS